MVGLASKFRLQTLALYSLHEHQVEIVDFMYIKACHADSPSSVILHLLPVPHIWEFTLVLTL
jgi:hypothetical protein